MLHLARLCTGLVLLTAALPAGLVSAAEVDKLWPDDAEFVLFLNVRQGLDSEIGKKHVQGPVKEDLHNRAEVRQFLEAVRLDPLRDIASATVAGRQAEERFSGLVVVRARFDLARIQTAAEEWARKQPEAVRFHEHDGLRIVEVKSGQPDRDPLFAAFLDKGLLVLSPSQQTLLDAHAKYAGKKSGAVSKDLQALVRRTDGKQTVWLAALLTGEFRKHMANDLLGKDRAARLQSVNGGVLLTDRIRADFRIQTTDRGTAAELRKNLDGLRVILSHGVRHNKQIPAYAPLLAEMLGLVRITSADEVVIIHAEISSRQIEEGLRKGKTR
jgi:hypothetical protein